MTLEQNDVQALADKLLDTLSKQSDVDKQLIIDALWTAYSMGQRAFRQRNDIIQGKGILRNERETITVRLNGSDYVTLFVEPRTKEK